MQYFSIPHLPLYEDVVKENAGNTLVRAQRDASADMSMTRHYQRQLEFWTKQSGRWIHEWTKRSISGWTDLLMDENSHQRLKHLINGWNIYLTNDRSISSMVGIFYHGWNIFINGWNILSMVDKPKISTNCWKHLLIVEKDRYRCWHRSKK